MMSLDAVSIKCFNLLITLLEALEKNISENLYSLVFVSFTSFF